MRLCYLLPLTLLLLASTGCNGVSRPPATTKPDAAPRSDGANDRTGWPDAVARVPDGASPLVDSGTNRDTALATDAAVPSAGDTGSTGGTGGGGASASNTGVSADAAVAPDLRVPEAGNAGSTGTSASTGSAGSGGTTGTAGSGGSSAMGGTSGSGGNTGSGSTSQDAGPPDGNQDSPQDSLTIQPDTSIPDAPALDPDGGVVVPPADTNTALSCPIPTVSPHTNVTVSSLAAGGTAVFICEVGYVLSGPSTLTCLANGTWSGAIPVCTSPAPNILFVTSTLQTANLGGLSGADSLCMARAQAAGLPGTYKAWLSSSTVNAKDRLGTASGWVRPDGKPVLNRIEDIALDRIIYPPRLDEFGNDQGVGLMLTGSDATGKRFVPYSSTTCGDFTSGTDEGSSTVEGGVSVSNSSTFASGFVVVCSTLSRIYCFGVDRAAQVSPEPATPGRRAFVTSATWVPGAGMASADALCQQEASDAGLTGSFKALLASTSASAASRFNTAGAPWVRSDGIPLTPLASMIFTTGKLTVAPNINAKGDSHFAGVAWSGANDMTAVGTEASTCHDWMSTDGTSHRGQFDNTDPDLFFGNSNSAACSFPTRLVCLQE